MPKRETKVIAVDQVPALIRQIREQRVLLDSDLARLYGVSTRRLNEQVRRNSSRFPEDFAFRLSRQEYEALMSQFATSSSKHGGRRKMPRVFTEHGAPMAAIVLNSPRAVALSVYNIRAFVKMREDQVADAALEEAAK